MLAYKIYIFIDTFLYVPAVKGILTWFHTLARVRVNDRLEIFCSVEQTVSCMTAFKFGNAFNMYIKILPN